MKLSDYLVVELGPSIYQFRDPLGVCFSIVLGSTHSLVIDTGYGIGNVRELVEQYIKTPYTVVLTHGHMDHSGGAYLFDEVKIPRFDEDLYLAHNSKEMRKKNIERGKLASFVDKDFDEESYLNANIHHYSLIDYDTFFDLGNRTVTVIPMEGHTKGSIGLLLNEERILFTGDAAIHNIWLFLDESTSKETYIAMLKRILLLPFDTFIAGHLMNRFDKSLIEGYLEVAEEATKENAKKVLFQGFEKEGTYQYTKNYNGINIGICFFEKE